jgi:hypothetical protein
MSVKTTYVVEGETADAIVDLRRMPTVETHMLNVLLAARGRLLQRDGRMAVVLSPRQRRRFGLLGLDRRFVLAADRRQAIERLGLSDDERSFRHARAA